MDQVSADSGGAGSGTLRSYATGFILSVVLTAIPFLVVMHNALGHLGTVIVIFSLAVIQMLVHLHYFLHLDASSRARWNVLAMLFTVSITFLVIGGTLWIMYNLNYRLG